MLFLPAIDVQGGGLARADRGGDPVAAARALAGAGIAWAHVVDLDRAHGAGRNDDTVRAVIAALGGVKVQLGGGLDQPDEVAQAVDWGVARVVLGTTALARLDTLVRRFGAHRLGVAVGPDADVVGLALRSGVTTVVYRNSERDGTLGGADLEGAARLLGRGADVILAGGVATLDEIRRGRDLGFAGVIVGRALLAGRFTLAEALECCG